MLKFWWSDERYQSLSTYEFQRRPLLMKKTSPEKARRVCLLILGPHTGYNTCLHDYSLLIESTNILSYVEHDHR